MYKIRLPNFEGPFDLLLYFIKRDEINIYDIPIARITEEFLKYIKIMQLFDLELAGEFILMASTLMYIKTQMLLPKPDFSSEGEIEDPRTQLVQRLIEYKQFKQASEELGSIFEEQRFVYYRQMFVTDNKLAQESISDDQITASLFDLMNAFRRAMEKASAKPKEHLVSLIPFSMEEKSAQILDTLSKRKKVSFFELTKNELKINIVVTFLALLDLIRKRTIIIVQNLMFDDIDISFRPDYNIN